jgi:hypothetical protein
MSHQLDGRQQLSLPPIIRIQNQRTLKDVSRLVEPLESYQAGGICVERLDLRFKQRGSLFEMNDCGRTVPLLIFQYRNHSVACGVRRPQMQKML